MQRTVRVRLLRAGRIGLVVQRPVARVPVVHAAAPKLRQRVDHRAARRGDERRPSRELRGCELAALPDGARRVDDQMAAVLPADEQAAVRRQEDGAAATREQRAIHDARRETMGSTRDARRAGASDAAAPTSANVPATER